MSAELRLPWPPAELSPNRRLHWARRAKFAKAYRERCFWETKAARTRVDWEGIVHLWLTFVPPDRRHRDDDNMIASFKSGRDGVAQALGINDKRFRLHPFVAATVGGYVLLRFTPELVCPD